MEFPTDTPPAVADAVNELVRNMTPQERFRRLCQLYAFGRAAMIAGIRQQYPDADDAEVFFRLAERLHGTDVAKKLCGR